MSGSVSKLFKFLAVPAAVLTAVFMMKSGDLESGEENAKASTAMSDNAKRDINHIQGKTEIEYIVEEGDTFLDISKFHEIPMGILARYNNLRNADKIRPGQTIKIPQIINENGNLDQDTVDYYMVKKGDTFNEVAEAHGLTPEELIALNPQITDIDHIYKYEKITIPGKNPAMIHAIAAGETLSAIARQYQTSVEKILNLNPDITDPSLLSINQEIKVPIETKKREAQLVRPKTSIYDIESGDTLSSVAKEHNTTLERLKELNPQITDINDISIDQQIMVPRTGQERKASKTKPSEDNNAVSYMVKKGDSFYDIAQKCGMTRRDLTALNPQIKDTSKLSIGQKINIPGGTHVKKSSTHSLEQNIEVCRTLLDFIGNLEAYGGNYNVAYKNKSPHAVKGYARDLKFTDMTLNEILIWQKKFVQSGYYSSAVGKYQFIPQTLKETIKNLGLSGNEKFSPAMQDRLAYALLKGRGCQQFLDGNISNSRFIKRLSMEWASLPKDSSNLSYYHNDGRNKALCSYNEMHAPLRTIKSAYASYQTQSKRHADGSLKNRKAHKFIPGQ